MSFSTFTGTETPSNSRAQTDFIWSDDVMHWKHWESNRNTPHSLLDVAVHMNSFSRLLPAQDYKKKNLIPSDFIGQLSSLSMQKNKGKPSLVQSAQPLPCCRCACAISTAPLKPASPTKAVAVLSLQAQRARFWCAPPCSAGNQCIYCPNLNCYKHYH